MKYQKIDVIDARQHDGLKVLVVSDTLGEQVANTGDWLLGTERGKVTVKSDAQFKAEGWKPYSETPADDQVKADEAALAEVKAQLASEQQAKTNLEVLYADVNAHNVELAKQVADTVALQSQVSSLQGQLEAANAQKAADEAQLAELKASLQAFTDAQAKAEAAQKAVQDALNK